MGPFLYTSTQCSGAFLACVLHLDESDDDEENLTTETLRPPLTPTPPTTKATSSEYDKISRKKERR